MSETRSRRNQVPLFEACQTLTSLAQTEMAEMRRRQNLTRKHNDMRDLLEDNYLGYNKALMSCYLPDNLPLNAVRYYIEQDPDYRLLASCPDPEIDENQRQRRHRSQMAFIEGVSLKVGDNYEMRWNILFNLTVMGALKDAELIEYHRQSLADTYTATKEMIDNHLPRIIRPIVFKAYPFIQSGKRGYSPFA